jgi:hypothetical protein
MKNKVKSIAFKLDVDGRGVVNYDSGDQVKIFRNHCPSLFQGQNYDNVLFAKKVFLSDKTEIIDNEGNKRFEDGKYRLKISSNCLRNAVFNGDTEFVNGSIMYADSILANYIASEQGIIRGYTFLGGDVNIKRKSAFMITDAIQTNENKSWIDVCTKGGTRDDTSLFFKETIGDIKYSAKGFIDLKQLQFIVCDELFDRLAVKSDWCEEGGKYITNLQKRYNTMFDGSKVGYYTLNNQNFTEKYGERGVMLSSEMVKYLAKYFFKNLLKMSIIRSQSYAQTEALWVKFINDNDYTSFGDDYGWEKVTIDNIDKVCEFELAEFYKECSEEQVKATKAIIDANNETKKNAKTEQKKKDKEEKARKKAEKENQEVVND